MLICPQCKFENPHDHKFCQNCGTSLTHKDCPKCMAEVPVDAQYCQNCGAECGTVWWAIIAQSETREETQEQTTQEQDKENFSNIPISSLQLTIGSYLDPEQRYQVLELLPAQDENTAIPVFYARILDCQPYQISPLEVLLANQQQDLVTPSVEVNAISNLAKAYIVLQSQNHPAIPAIHNAWQRGDMQVILIEDRSNWQDLLELWQKETTSSLQILHWCYQMTQLWTILEPVNCRQSLLELSNLRLDEDQTLALQRLYVEPLDVQPAIELPENEEADTLISQKQPLTVKALGEIWQMLFRQSQRTQFGSIVQILEDLELDKIQTIAHLRSRLEDIAIELEVPIPTIFEPMEEKDIAVSATVPTNELEEDIAARNDDLPTVVLSMQLSTLEDAGRTDVGRQRHHNEDCFGIETKIDKLELPRNRVLEARGLYILCDGMGGHAGGEVASELAVNTLRKYFHTRWVGNQLPTKDSIREAVNLANQAIYEVNQQDARSGVGRMGTTLVMLLIQDTQAAVAHVGDSRLYSVTRKRGLEQITVDHEVGQREIARGVEASIAYARPDAYQLTQALGPRDEKSINPDVNFFEINEDSLLMLVSDGLSDNDLLENHWQTHINPLLSSGANLERGVTELIDLANQYNGHDNITAILVRAKVRPNMEGTGD